MYGIDGKKFPEDSIKILANLKLDTKIHAEDYILIPKTVLNSFIDEVALFDGESHTPHLPPKQQEVENQCYHC